MTCEINLEGLYKMVKKRLDTYEGKIDPKAVVADIYDTIHKGVMAKTNDPDNARNQAMAYARMAPTMIRQGMMSDSKLFFEAAQNKFDFTKLAEMEEAFKKDIRQVYTMVESPVSKVEEAAVMQERIEEKKEEERVEQVAGVFQEEIQQQKKKHGKYSPGFLATTGAEWKAEPWKYKLQRKILRLVNKNKGERRNGQNINLPGVGPVMLRLLPVTSLGEMHWDKTRQEDGSYQLVYIPKPEDVAYVLVDKAGNILYFDDQTGELSSQDAGGRIAYWYLYKPENFIQKSEDGSMSLKPYLLGTPKSDSQKEARKQFMGVADHYSDKTYGKPFDKLNDEQKNNVANALFSQLSMMQMAHDYAIANLEKKKYVDFDIVGGTLGYKTDDKRDELKHIPLQSLGFLNENNFQIELVNVKGDTYPTFTYDGKTTQVKVDPGIPEDYAETITSLLFDDNLLNQDGNPMTVDERVDLIQRFTNPGQTRVKQNGKTIRFRFNNSKLKIARKADGSLFVMLVPTKENGRHDYNAAPVDISDNPNNRQMVKDYLMDAQFMQVSKHYSKNPRKFAIPVLETQPDGSKKVRMEPVYYHSFVLNVPQFFIEAKNDPSGDAMLRDSYFTVAPNENDLRTLLKGKPDKTIVEKVIAEEGKKPEPSKKPSKKKNTGFQGYKGGFDNKGKGTREGDGKDKAMREAANGFIGELGKYTSSSTLTSAARIHKVEEPDIIAAVTFSPDKGSIAPANLNDKATVIMLARNNEGRKGKPLFTTVKEAILEAHNNGAEFIVGDMPGVDSQFIDYLQEIGAKFTIYHTGTTPRINIAQERADVEKEAPKPEPKETPKSDTGVKTKSKFDAFMDQNKEGWDKLRMQKTGNIPATKKQIEEARKWYESSPLRQHIPFEVMFNAVNSRNPNSVAEFSTDGIILYKGSDFTDLYHEAWHGFSQTFLTHAQRAAMYKEVSRKTGSFKDYNGKIVEFAFASEKQLEEYLAEKFREFMLSDGVKVDSQTPKTNNIFQRILNFLKELFGTTTYTDGVMNPGITKNVDELFQKLRVGNISEFSFDTKNRAYGVLFSTIKAVDDQAATRTKLSYQDTSLIVESVDSIFSNVMDWLNENVSGNTKRFSNTLYKSNNNKMRAYKVAYQQFNNIQDDLKEKLANARANNLTEINGMSLDDAQYYLDLVTWTIDNFGSLESLEENMKSQKGVIYAHIQKSKLLSNEDKEAATSDEKDEGDTFKKAKGESFERSGQDLSLKEMASKEILYIMRGLYKRDKKGNVEYNVLGLPKLNDFDKSWNFLARNLEGKLDVTKMYDKLKEIASGAYGDKDYAAVVNQLLEKLGDVDESVDYDGFHLWTNFWTTFNKTRVPLVQMTLKASKGNAFMEVNYMVTLGEAQSSSRQVITNWENRFATTRTKYIRQTQIEDKKRKRYETVNYLDIESLLSNPDYANLQKLLASPNKMFDFLGDAGIVMSYKTPILTALKDDPDIKQAVAHIWRTLNFLKWERRDLTSPIQSIEDIFAEHTDEEGNVKIENAFNRLNDLKELEAKYGDVVNSFMVSNAEGNPQFEHSLNSTLTVLVEAINNAETFEELYKTPHMAHFDPKRNPSIESSIWLKSIFNVKADGSLGGKRKVNGKPVRISFENLSGVKTIDEYGNEEGVASASSDPSTKFILDFHTFMMRGSPELPRHADKNTSYAAFVTDILTDDDKKKSSFKYIDDADFFVNKAYDDVTDAELSKTHAFRSIMELLMPYVKSELKRIEIMKDLEGTGIDYDYFYMKQGQKFNIFDDVFSTELKNKLIESGSDNYTKHKQEIAAAFETYFTNLTDKNLKLQRKASYIDPSVKRIINREIREKINAVGSGAAPVKRIRMSEETFRKNSMMSYVVNSWIHNLEAVTVFYGDLAMYNHEKQEFHKRNAGAGSTGDLFRTDRVAITYARSLERLIGIKETGRNKQMSYDGTFDTAVFEDSTSQAEYFDQYSTAIRDYFNSRYKDPEVAKKKADKVIEKYTKDETKEGDGQGWITLDAYRIMLSLQGKWSSYQEEVYRKIAEGKQVDTEEMLQIFPVKKVQYWGPLQTETGPPIMAFHKFSLVPLIPNVIKGTNLELLHKKMMQQDIDYSLFKSASKTGTVTNATGKSDIFYSNEDKRTFDTTSTLTKNTIFLNYLKDQVDTGDNFKQKITIPTQMRKLLVDGFMHVGVPVDFKPELSDEERIKRWDALCPGCSKADLEKSRKAASVFYGKYKNYEEQVDALTRKKYEELLKKIDFREVNGKPVGNIANLVNYIRTQFEQQDLSDHEKEFIQMSSEGGLKHDLSLSFSADKIEKLLNAIVVKQLVKQKMKGEGLIQVSVAGWEKIGTSRELSTYHLKDGVIQPMQIKVALQGDFLKLLKHPMVKSLVEQGKGKITELQALNIMINDKTWLAEGNNKKMVMMTGTRIPVQGHNSMEFMQITEFLPTTAGHMIIAPSELVSKSGGDFDIDKLFTMMPYIKYDKKTGEVTYDSERTENKLIESQIDLLSTKENFVNLIRPNATDIFDDMAQDLAPDVSEYNPMENQNPDPERLTRKGKPMMSPTRILELPYNIYKQNTNSVGKAVLGIGAVENTYNVLFNRIGMYMNPTNGLTFDQYYELKDYVLKHQKSKMKPGIWFTIGGVRKKWPYKEVSTIVKNFGRQVIAMPHNTRTVQGKKVISIANMYDAKDENRISDIISQMINGWVDVAKEAWIFHVQGNKELTPTLLYLIQAGVPVEQAVYFVSQPLVRQYVEKQRDNKGTFAGPLGTKPSSPNLANYNAKKDILLGQCGIASFETTQKVKDGEGNERQVTKVWYDKIDAFQKTIERTQPYMEKGFEETELRKRIKDYNEKMKEGEEYVADDFDIAAFLHFLEIEEQAKALTQFKRTTNVDTSRQSTLFEARKKEMAVAELKANGRIPVEMVDKIQKETVIGSFFDVLKWQQEIWGPYFKIRDNGQLNDTLTDIFAQSNGSDIVNDTFNGDYEKFANEFRNDFMVYLFQKDLYSFDLKTLKSYKGYGAMESTSVQDVDFLKSGVMFKDGNVYIDKRQLEKDYMSLGSVPQKFLGANVDKSMFHTPGQYYKFVIEREYLRSMYPMAALQDTIFFKEKLKLNKYLKRDIKDEEMLGIATYEEILRDMALTNTFNIKHMFKGKHGDSMAAKLQTIVNNHPELKDNYKVLEALGIQKTGDTWNIKLVDRVLDSDKIELYHENLTELMDPDKMRVNADYADKKLIADFFSKIGIYSILQSGFNTNSTLALQRIANQDRYLNEISRITEPYTRKNNPEKFEPEMMTDYKYKFISNVNSLKNKDRLRFKDYIKPVNKYNKRKVESTDEEIALEGDLSDNVSGLREDANGRLRYDISGFEKPEEEVEKLVKENPNVLFVFQDTYDSEARKATGKNMLNGYLFKALVGKYPNVVGLPTRLNYSHLFSQSAIKDIVTEGKPQVDPVYAEQLEMAIAQVYAMVDEEPDYRIAMPENGFGQIMVNANENNPSEKGPEKTESLQTFKYLSEKLYSTFGYVNPNYTEHAPDAEQFIKETQPVTDEMVLDQLKFCYGIS